MNEITPEDIATLLGAAAEIEKLEARIAAALEAWDVGVYGDPEVPFRMRAALNGVAYE